MQARQLHVMPPNQPKQWCFPHRIYYGRCQHIAETWVKGTACTHDVELHLEMLCFYVNVSKGTLAVEPVAQRPNEFCPIPLCQVVRGASETIDYVRRNGWGCCQCNRQRIPGNAAYFVLDSTRRTVGYGHYTASSQWHHVCQNCDNTPLAGAQQQH